MIYVFYLEENELIFQSIIDNIDSLYSELEEDRKYCLILLSDRSTRIINGRKLSVISFLEEINFEFIENNNLKGFALIYFHSLVLNKYGEYSKKYTIKVLQYEENCLTCTASNFKAINKSIYDYDWYDIYYFNIYSQELTKINEYDEIIYLPNLQEIIDERCDID